METNLYLILSLLAVALGLLLRFTIIRFSRAVKPNQKLIWAIGILAVLAGIHGVILYLILRASGMIIAFRPAMAALLIAAVFTGCAIVMCYVLRKKRKLSEEQKLELNAM